ncbi:MAG: hypothetical protein IKV47_07230 [Oscillospiraceae bacterium]|nr:hypothetical protein [Oscillospiraceae bacterium]
MNNFRNKLAAFFYGRYGYDQLGYALFGFYIAIVIINAFVGSLILSLLGLVSVGIMFFRVLSRNIYKRRAENERFLKLWRPTAAFFKLQWDRLREIKTNRYRKCPDCKAVLRLPNKKGDHTVVCPRCRKRFDVRIRF